MPAISTPLAKDRIVTGAEPYASATSAGVSTEYVPALDGLRGLAVLAVMVYHAFPSLLPGGFAGVDMFFVLSGFLITGLLLKEWTDLGRIDLRCFYMRRVLRLLPALWLMLLTIVVFVTLFLPEDIAQATQTDALLAVCNVLNWARIFEWSEKGLLGHTWSLCIEEQFYLLWPVTLCLVLRSAGSAGLARRLLGFALVFAVCRIVLVMGGASVTRVYQGLDTRIDNLLLGCALAAALLEGWLRLDDDRTRALLRRMIPAAILSLVLVLLLAHSRSAVTFIVVLPLVGISTCVVIGHVLAAGPDDRWQELFERPRLVWCGRRSYGLYLWHYPVFQVLGPWGFGFSPIQVALVGMPLTFAIASASYVLVERPILKFKDHFQPARAAAETAAVKILIAS